MKSDKSIQVIIEITDANKKSTTRFKSEKKSLPSLMQIGKASKFQLNSILEALPPQEADNTPHHD